MFEKTLEVIKEKKKRATEQEKLRRKENTELKNKTIFKARFENEKKYFDVALKHPMIKAVKFKATEQNDPLVSEMMYGKEMENYVTEKNGLIYKMKERTIDI